MFREIKQWVKQSRAARVTLSLPLALRRSMLIRSMRDRYAVVNTLAKFGRSDIQVSIPEFDVIFTLSPNSTILHRFLVYSYYEPTLSKIFLEHVKADYDVVDVGANVGFYTVAAAKRLTTGRVLAVEPTSGAFNRLCRNIERNSVANSVITERLIVSDNEESVNIRLVPGLEEYASVGEFTHSMIAGREYEVEAVSSSTLDSLVAKHGLHPGAIKVDVEGGEGKVFAGALKTLATYRPFVLSECSDRLLRVQGSSASELFALFESLQYRVINPEAPSVAITPHYEGDIFCIPPGA